MGSMTRSLLLVVLLALGAWSGCGVDRGGLQPLDASAGGGGGGVSHAGGVAAGGTSGSGEGSGGAAGSTGAPFIDGGTRSDDAQASGGSSGSDVGGGEDVAAGSGGGSGSDVGAGEDLAAGSGGSSGNDVGAGEDFAAGSGGSSGNDAGADAGGAAGGGGNSGNDAGADAVDAPKSGGNSGSDAAADAAGAAGSGGSSGSDAGADADGAADSPGTASRDAGLEANDSARSDGASGKDAGFDSGPNWRPVWSDEFNLSANTGADATKWNVPTWEPNTVNGEQQKYTARVQNVFHDGQGHLVLRGLHDFWTSNGTVYPYTSGRLQSDGKFQFSFGRVEVRAKLPAGQGSFPAILLMGTTGNWPQCGEIGMMEQWGQDKSWLYCSTYSGTSSDINQKVTFPNTTTLSSDFHVYALEWYSDHMVFFIDDVQVARSNFDTTSPFSTGSFYLILDVAIGGTMGGTIDDVNGFPMDMVLDYVRVYQQP